MSGNGRSAVPSASLPASAAGRMCPFDYRYSPHSFNRAPDITTDVLYVVGGLYGNLAALDVIERLPEAERGDVTVVFNGDFHWFDAEPAWFNEVDRRVAAYPALRGNVETEIARNGDIGAGCGCAYPETVGDDVVRRSNEILLRLRGVAHPDMRARLQSLPLHLVAQVGDCRVGIVHGDAWSLAGWRFAQDMLDAPRCLPQLHRLRAAADIDVFACTHTCAAVLRDFATPAGRLTIVNNGAAGMPNFHSSRYGVVTRIAVTPSPHSPLYGTGQYGVHVDALSVHYDHTAFLARFGSVWPEGSPACKSYLPRIEYGPDYAIGVARPQTTIAIA
jgi:hypothetical protein